VGEIVGRFHSPASMATDPSRLLRFAYPSSNAADVPTDPPSSRSTNSTAIAATAAASTRVSILLCPAQFCVPADYDRILDDLNKYIPNLGYSVTAPLSRRDWIKVARQLPTRRFFTAELPVEETLRWYFQAMEAGLADILARESESNEKTTICIVGHSIGGWVARAYLAGLSQSSTAIGRAVQQQQRVSSLVTLGTPNTMVDTSLVDQTRGLLSAIAATPSAHPRSFQQRGISVACVASAAIQGQLFTSNVQQLVAATSYGPLSGNWAAVGDGIVPIDLAFLDDPAERVIVDKAEHIHVLPTPWNLWDGTAPSIPLGLDSYFGADAMAKWAPYVR
jgi:pimeloyl-ACP methyl ester carboxylesterase